MFTVKRQLESLSSSWLEYGQNPRTSSHLDFGNACICSQHCNEKREISRNEIDTDCKFNSCVVVFVSRNTRGNILVCCRLAWKELRIPFRSQRKLLCVFLSYTFTTQLLWFWVQGVFLHTANLSSDQI